MQRWWQIRLKQSRDGFKGGARNWKSICTLAQMCLKKKNIRDVLPWRNHQSCWAVRPAVAAPRQVVRIAPKVFIFVCRKMPRGGWEDTASQLLTKKPVIAFSPPEVKDKRERAATPQSWWNFAGTGQKLRDPSLCFLCFFFFFFRMCREIPKLEHMQNEFVPSGASLRGILQDLRRRRLRAITEPVGRARVKEVIIPTLIGVVWVSSARLCRHRLWLLQTKHFGHLFRS